MIAYTPIDPTQLDYSLKTSFLVENRDWLEDKEYLLNIFTCSEKRIGYLPANVNGKDIIRLDTNTAFDLVDLLEFPIVAIPKEINLQITFPTEEIDQLTKQDRIITTRIGLERTKYHIGDTVQTPWGQTYTVTDIIQCRNLSEHPYLSELTSRQKEQLQDHRFAILTLDLVRSGHKGLAGKNFTIYGVLNQSIPRSQLPLTDQQGQTPAQLVLIKLSEAGDIPIYDFIDTFTLVKGMIDNYQGPGTETTVGRYLVNQLVLVKPFGNRLPYINEVWKISQIDQQVANLILAGEIGRREYELYMDYGYFIGQSCELGVSGISKKALTTDPRVKELRAKLIAENKDNLSDPTVITTIESQLIAMDKAWMADDEGSDFYAVTAGKSYSEHRKKMFLTMGLFQAFGKDTNDYAFVPNSLAEGWDRQHLPTIINEARRGSHSRAVGTASGGEETKFVIRVFQDIHITENDCFTTRGMPLILTEQNYQHIFNFYRYAYINGKKVKIDNSNYQQYLGKLIYLRTPQYCQAKKGLCYACAGGYFEQLKNPNIGMLALDITAKFTSIELKSMHVAGVKTLKITDLSSYLIS